MCFFDFFAVHNAHNERKMCVCVFENTRRCFFSSLRSLAFIACTRIWKDFLFHFGVGVGVVVICPNTFIRSHWWQRNGSIRANVSISSEVKPRKQRFFSASCAYFLEATNIKLIVAKAKRTRIHVENGIFIEKRSTHAHTHPHRPGISE